MKITSDLLQGMPSVPGFTAPLSSGKSEPPPAPEIIQVPDPPVLVEHCTFQQQDLKELKERYTQRALEYITPFMFSIASHLQEALQQRARGEKVLTLREADIAARGKVNLGSSLVLAGLSDGLNFLVEGIVGVPDNPFELRYRYNRGIDYKRTKYAEDTPARQEAARKIMKHLIYQLTQADLPPWPTEITEGFPGSFCYPEFMTKEQYGVARTRVRKLVQTSGYVEEPVTEEEE